MTEAEWLACSAPSRMLSYLKDKVSARKQTLFACACCRRMANLAVEKISLQAVRMAELGADNLASSDEVQNAWFAAVAAGNGSKWASRSAARAVGWAVSGNWMNAANNAANTIAGHPELPDWRTARAGEEMKQTDLIRHIVGNPFRSYSAPAHWPANVTDLATSLYDGGDCAFALHDALLEAGYAELAEHFHEHEHPKGCWAVDLILGKA